MCSCDRSTGYVCNAHTLARASENLARVRHIRAIQTGSNATQSQDSLTDQLYRAIDLANRAGLYDAADWIRAQLNRDTQ